MNHDEERQDHLAMNDESRITENTRKNPEYLYKNEKNSQTPKHDHQYRDHVSDCTVTQNVPQQYKDQASNYSVPQNVPEQYRDQASNSSVVQNVPQQYREKVSNSCIPQNVPQQYRDQASNSSVPQNVHQQYRDQASNSNVPQNVHQQYSDQASNSNVPQNVHQQYRDQASYSSVQQNMHQYASCTKNSKMEGKGRSCDINTPEKKCNITNPMPRFYDNSTPDVDRTTTININSGGTSQGRSASYSDKRSATIVQHRRPPCSYAGHNEEDVQSFYFNEGKSVEAIQNTPCKVEESRFGIKKQTSNETTPTSKTNSWKVTTNEKQLSTPSGYEETVRFLTGCSPSNSRPCSPVRVVSCSSGIPHTCSSLNSSVSEANAVCRICHGDGRREQLLSPCYCAGSIGMLHLSCLQRWLGSSNKTHCELCNFQFTMEKRPKPFTTFIRNPGSAKDKRHTICDFVCFLFLTPLTISAISFCIRGSLDTDTKKVESIGLSTLGAALFILYIIWLTVCIKHHVGVWRDWQQFNQDVKLKCHPPKEGPKLVPINEDGDSSTMPSKGARRGTVKLCSIEINVTTSSDVSPRVKVSKKKNIRLPCSNIEKSPSPHHNLEKQSASLELETTECSSNFDDLMNAGRMNRCISKETYV